MTQLVQSRREPVCARDYELGSPFRATRASAADTNLGVEPGNFFEPGSQGRRFDFFLRQWRQV